jgi:hypothetical protein
MISAAKFRSTKIATRLSTNMTIAFDQNRRGVGGSSFWSTGSSLMPSFFGWFRSALSLKDSIEPDVGPRAAERELHHDRCVEPESHVNRDHDEHGQKNSSHAVILAATWFGAGVQRS